MQRGVLRRRAGVGPGRRLQDGLSTQVVRQRAVGGPHCELAVDARLDHLLLPGDGDAPRGKRVIKVLVLISQLDAFDRGESPNVVDVLDINRVGVWHKGGREDPWWEGDRKKMSAGAFSLCLLSVYYLRRSCSSLRVSNI